MQRFFSFVGGVLMGSLVAGTMALLFAPRPGTETRRYLAEKSEEIGKRASEMGDRAQSMSQRLGSRTHEYSTEAERRMR